MKKSITTLLCLVAIVTCFAQVKSSYIYNTSMPYGTLDLRTKISSTDYYYLEENKTFSYRESSPGVRTNSYRNMTSWDSSPYKQGNLRRKKGTLDYFIMNYRILFPQNYNPTYAQGYPMIVLMHGAVERGNCYYNNCYHSTWSYDPNVNSPKAPTSVDHRLLNNDHNLNVGGKQHLDARNLAGTRLPNDPTLPARAFAGFILIPQMFNVWDSLNVQDMIRIVRLHCQKYKIDQNRIYIHGLSIGGYATYEAIKRASWLFTAALPMSAVGEAANIFKHNQQNRVAHIPLWIFQGGLDKNPTPSFTSQVVSKFKGAGASVRYTVFSDLGHNVWNRAYSQSDFFSWMKSRNKANIHVRSGITTIVKSKNQYPKLMLAEGFLAYQWEKNGIIISGAASPTYTATTPGIYRARFSRVSSSPTSASQWNRWSASVRITESTTTTTAVARSHSSEEAEPPMEEEIFSVTFYPNPATADNLNIQLNSSNDAIVKIKLVDLLGREVYQGTYRPVELEDGYKLPISHALPDGMYIITIHHGSLQIKERLMIKN